MVKIKGDLFGRKKLKKTREIDFPEKIMINMYLVFPDLHAEANYSELFYHVFEIDR